LSTDDWLAAEPDRYAAEQGFIEEILNSIPVYQYTVYHGISSQVGTFLSKTKNMISKPVLFFGTNEELRDLYSPPSVIRIMKSRRMRWAGYVARME
jgi:hypothetical protein